MHRAFIYLLLAFVVAASCLLEYWGAKLLAPLSTSKQNRIAIVSIALFVLVLAVSPTNIVLTNCFVLAVGLFAGMLLGRQIGSVGALMAFLLTAAIVDIISTHTGPTRWIASHAQQPHHGLVLLQFLAISFRWKGEIVGVIGVGDLMFFTACVCIMRRLGWPETPVLFVPLLGILSALGVGLFAGMTPAIPFLAIAVIVYAYASSSMQRKPCHS